MSDFIEFISLSNPTVKIVLIGVILISFSSSLVGNFAFLRKRAMLGDAISHSVFPGVCLSFIISGEKDPFSILIYSIVSGLVAMFLIDVIGRHKKVKVETSIGIVLSIFFGLGIMLLSYIQGNLGSSQSGLQHFFFGQAAAMSKEDVQVFFYCTLIIFGVIVLFYKGLKQVSFDREHAIATGQPVILLEVILSILTVMAIAIGINAVGVILMAALLITPASTARLWTNRLFPMIVIAASLSIVSAIGGAFISYKYSGMPTGPWVVVILSVMAFISILFSPKRGALSRLMMRKKLERKILKENILKTIFKLQENHENGNRLYTLQEINELKRFDGDQLQKGLNLLKKEHSVTFSQGKWELTEAGEMIGKRITRVHRLWELYLTNKVNLDIDHVHPSAESLEHIITPEIEQMLQEELGYPTSDPHHKMIP
jgi:manganese/zinc/iron transport system permease protein